MKAIIVTFDGDIKNESELVNQCMLNVHEFTNAREMSVSLISDKELAEMLIKETTTRKTDPELNAIQDFCKKIVTAVGTVPLRTKEIANKEVCRFLVQQNSQTIAAQIAIIAKINSTKQYERHREILQTYGLSFLPQLLRDLNPTFKFYLYGKEKKYRRNKRI